MKLTILLLLSILSAQALSAKCTVPMSCEIISSEFSTGGGDKLLVLMEVDCKKADGTINKYIHQKASAAGLLGFGRWVTPEKITFVKSTDPSFDKLVCKY